MAQTKRANQGKKRATEAQSKGTEVTRNALKTQHGPSSTGGLRQYVGPI